MQRTPKSSGRATTSTMPLPALGLFLSATLISLSATPQTATAAQTNAPEAPTSNIGVETVVSGLANPWGLEFLPDGRYLVTERSGKLKIISADGASTITVTGVPKVRARGQGGLMDITLSPDHAETGLLYLSYSEPTGSRKSRTAVARAKLDLAGTDAARLSDLQVIFQQTPAVSSGRHFGSRIVVANDGSLFITTGDRGNQQQSAQDPQTTIGVVARINSDGTPHKDNPKNAGWKPEIYSIGHRNIQGAAIDPDTGTLWTAEHGARGGDELNKPEAGKNYGWPVITYGRDYSGAKIGVGQKKDGFEQPVYYWDPSIATSGLEIVSGKQFSNWRGDILVGGLAGAQLSRLKLNNDRTSVVAEEVLLSGEGLRIREVREGPAGAIYVLVDERNGSLLKLTPRQPS
ncbi:MAG: PQQ-dependent sugar dehydrogenase [Pseudomonadota bacterium]